MLLAFLKVLHHEVHHDSALSVNHAKKELSKHQNLRIVTLVSCIPVEIPVVWDIFLKFTLYYDKDNPYIFLNDIF